MVRKMDVTNDNKQDGLKASNTSKESEIMSNEITDDKVIEIVSGPEITQDDARSSQNQESINDGITEDDAVSSPKEFQWKKYVFVAVMLIMVFCFFFKTENVSKQEKPDYEIKKSTIQYEAPAEMINPTLPKSEEKESITKSEKNTHKNTKAKKIDSENKIKADSKKVVTKVDSEKVNKKTKADSEKVKTESDSERIDIKTDTVEDKMLVKEIEEKAKKENYQQNNELEEEKKIKDEKREKEATRKKYCKNCGITSIVIGFIFISIWLILGYGACGYTCYQKNDAIASKFWIKEYNYNHPFNRMTIHRFFLWYDSCDLAIFVIGLLLIIFGAALFYAFK